MKKFVLAALVVFIGSNSAVYSQRPDDLTAPPTNSWPKSGGNLFNQNYSPLTQINRENVAQMKAVWRASLGGSGNGAKYSGEAQPIFHDGYIYIVTGANDVFAIGVKTGETHWIRSETRRQDHHYLLRLDKPRPRARRRQDLCRAARWPARRT